MTSAPRGRTVSDVMTSRVHVGRPMTPFKVLVQLIEDNKISAVPIVDDQGFPVGIVSESDLLDRRSRRQERYKAPALVASEIMTAPPISVRCETTLPHAARLMQERNVRHLVVVNKRGRIEGIVSRSDLLAGNPGRPHAFEERAIRPWRRQVDREKLEIGVVTPAPSTR